MSLTGIGLAFLFNKYESNLTHIENVLEFTFYQEVNNQLHAYQLIINR
jgi:hypothetical protein